MKTSPLPTAAGAWAQLAIFRIYKDVFPDNHPSLRLFNNTRQQCRVRVILVGLDADGNEVDIPAADLDNLELIEYDTEIALQRIDDFNNHPDLAYSTMDQGYVWDESKVPATMGDATSKSAGAEAPGARSANGSAAIRPNQQVVTYYVSAKSLQVKQIAARITHGKSSFKTNSFTVSDPDGRGNGTGGFNSSVTIRPTAFPSLPLSEYGDISSSATLIPYAVGSSAYFYSAVEHRLRVRYNNTDLALRSVSASVNERKGFSIYKKGGLSDDKQWSISYYGQPGTTVPEKFPLAPLDSLDVVAGQVSERDDFEPYISYKPMDMFKNCVGTITTASETLVVIGLLVGNIRARFLNADGQEVPSINMTTLHIIDVYGNDHVLSISFGGKVDEMILGKG